MTEVNSFNTHILNIQMVLSTCGTIDLGRRLEGASSSLKFALWYTGGLPEGGFSTVNGSGQQLCCQLEAATSKISDLLTRITSHNLILY